MYTQYFQPHPFLITLTQKGNVNEPKKKKMNIILLFQFLPKKNKNSVRLTISTESAGSTNGFPSFFTDLKGHPALVLNTGHSPKPLDAEWRALNISINHFWWSGVNSGILDISSNISLMFFAFLKGQLFLNSGHFMNSFMMGSSANLWGYGQPSLNAKQWSLMETFSKAPWRKEQILCNLFQLVNTLELEKPLGEGEHSFILMRCKLVSGKRPPSSRFKRECQAFCVKLPKKKGV